ncbi:TPA: ead/Ea22-like family protein [Klebsiella pneumoniae]
MTDITELAQSLKAAAEKATPGPWALARDRKTVVSNQSHPITNVSDAMHRMLADGTTGQDAEFISLANPNNVIALVEALEKAQQRITQMESRTVTDWIEHDGKWRPESLGLDELVYLKTRKQELKIPYPAGKVKGWMNTGGDMDVMAYKLASPQASAVTVKLTDINEYLAEVHDKTLNRALRLLAEGVRAGDVAAMRAAGIKVEAE